MIAGAVTQIRQFPLSLLQRNLAQVPHLGPVGSDMPSYEPEANGLVLVRQVNAIAVVEVEGLNGAGVAAEEVLGAAFGCQILVVTAVLGHLTKKKIFA